MRFTRFAALTALLAVLCLGLPSHAEEIGFVSKDAISLPSKDDRLFQEADGG